MYRVAGGSTNFTAHLWNSSGTSLGSVTISTTTDNAWAGSTLTTPVNILANTTYIVSYSTAANGAYKAVANGLAAARTNGPLTFLAGNNGVYANTAGTFPNQNGNGVDYGADVFMTTTPTVQPTFSPAPGTYVGTQTITLSSTTPGATIRYTTNNTAPNATSPTLASGGTIVISASATLQADAVTTSQLNSFVSSGSYVITNATFGTTNILTSSANPSVVGSNVTFTATVTSTNGVPAGTMTFNDGATVLGTAMLNGSGVGTFTTSTLSVGSHSITAAYGGNASYTASTSPALNQAINLSDGTTRLSAINAGGAATNGFAADAGYVNGATISTANTINLSAVTNPAPMAVYQSERYGTNFTYTFTGLAPSNACLVRLHFSENWGPDGKVGGRFFNVAINGLQRLTNFDIFATAGTTNKAVIRQFDAAADGSGQVAINFTSGVGSPDPNAKVDGLEQYTVTPFDAWRVANFTAAQLDNANVSGLTADPDGDGIINFVEYALGTNPLVFNTTGQPYAGTDGQGRLTLTFFRARADVTYIVEGSTDLTNPNGWTTIATNPGSVGQKSVTDTATPNSSPRFLRVQFGQ